MTASQRNATTVLVSTRTLVEFILLGPATDRRQLQDSPVLGDVWIAFANDPSSAQDLLVSPFKTRPAGPVAATLAERIRKLKLPRAKGEESHVAYLQGIVAARLFFRELLQVVVPMTSWWRSREVEKHLGKYTPSQMADRFDAILKWVTADEGAARARVEHEFATLPAIDRYVVLAGLILWASSRPARNESAVSLTDRMAGIKDGKVIVKAVRPVFDAILGGPHDKTAQVWQVSLNRTATPALEKSVPAVKGDAARTLFNVSCRDIAWAVIDSGIDGSHHAFTDPSGKSSRVVKSFDFSNIRRIVSLDNIDPRAPGFAERLADLTAGRRHLRRARARELLVTLAQDASHDRPVNWALVEPFIEIDPTTQPSNPHGTHVAGIIGAWAGGVKAAREKGIGDGMCPDIQLYDFRVLSSQSTVADTEFAIIAALQYLRYLNESRSFMTIHGANLSLSIAHDVRNFACGRTPICNECERLVDSGVVVVAAAGNLGYQTFETKDGAYDGYTAFSITDPGNADAVVTVGATHRSWPHTYGVSFFSSRGPTGDGRAKPDLVAPGERIHSCVPGNDWKDFDGTSMAAPHVSGAAAMLMARYAELVGQPRRVKQLLCDTATDLGRERSFQGHGMLDVLRALQRV